MTLARTFLGSVLIGALLVVGMALYDPATPRPAPVPPDVSHRLIGDVSVSTQVTLAGVAKLREAGYRTVIDMRPDGEAKDQAPSAAVEQKARSVGLTFVYLPTPHGNIPDSIPDKLAETLATVPKPVMLYCRSGSRASRAWALAEAGRPGGSKPEEISRAVKSAGLSVDDLMARIGARVQSRPQSQ